MTSTDREVPGLLEVLTQVQDPRKKRGRRFGLVFMVAVAVVCVLAGAKSFREIGDQAANLPQELLARPGGRLLRHIVAPSEKRIRSLIQALDATALDVIVGSWLRALDVTFSDLQGDLMAAGGSGYPEDLARLLRPRPIWRHAEKRRAVGDEVLSEVLVQDVPVTRLVGVNRLDVSLNEGLVLLGRHL